MYIVHHPLAGIMNNKTKYMSLGIVQEKKKKNTGHWISGPSTLVPSWKHLSEVG